MRKSKSATPTMQESRPESQRMVCETAVGLPLTKEEVFPPTATTLDEFLNRKKEIATWLKMERRDGWLIRRMLTSG